jgi:2,3-diaminopropionate biosynthesis protein SbnA
MIFESASDVVVDDVFVRLPDFVRDVSVLLKLEGLNPAGSVKLKSALALVKSAEANGTLAPGSRLIESSSGNLGIALSTVCAARGYQLTVVTDPNAARQAIRAMESLGTDVVEVTHRDASGGYLGTRLDYIRRRITDDPQLVWLNQYANLANIRAHKERTAKAIHRELGEIDALFVGVGTTGTLMGCLEYFSENSPRTRVVAVDAVGSVTFGGTPAPRFIPGLGTSRRPEIFTDSDAFEKVHIEEIDAIATCRMLAARYGLLVGGSTGTVLAAVRLLTPTLRSCRRIVAISPDMGDKYLDTVYSDTWVAERYAGILDLSGLDHPIAS